MTKNTGGRPTQYTVDQIREAIRSLLGEGLSTEQIDAKCVKLKLCSLFDVSTGINEQSLQTHVTHVLAELAEDEQRALLKSLPAAVVPAVDEMMADLKKRLLLLVGQQNSICQKAAAVEAEELRQDKKNANWRIAELEAEVADLRDSIASLQQKGISLATQLNEAKENLALAEAELTSKAQSSSTVDLLLAELREPSVRDAISNSLRELVLQANPERADIVSRRIVPESERYLDIRHGPVSTAE